MSLRKFWSILAIASIATSIIPTSALAAGNSTITYNANSSQYQTGVTSGTVPTPTTVAQGTVTVAANSGNLARQGFTFAGWNTLANGTGQTYAAGSGTFNLTGDITLYAKWEIPAAARLIGNGGSIHEFKNTAGLAGGTSCAGKNVRGITSDGTYMYFRPSGLASKICKMDLNGEFVAVSPDLVLPGTGDSIAMTYSSGCIFLRVTGVTADSEIKCVSTTDWSVTTIPYPVGKGLFAGSTWLYGNMITFPDGRIGAVSAPNFGTGQAGCPSGMVCKILRLYNVIGTGASASLTFSADMYLADESVESGWPDDDHGIATDGTYLYQVRHANGYKVWALRDNAPSYIVFNADKTGETTCKADSSIGSGTKCTITYPINGSSGTAGTTALSNSTYLGRNHTTGQYFLGDYGGKYFYKSTSATPPPGPGTLDQSAPTFNNSASFTFAENSATTTIAATISVSESATLTLLAGGDSSLLNLTVIDSTTAHIKLNSVPNFEAPIDSGADNTYICTVRATDTLGNTDTQTITISVTDSNEAPVIVNYSSNPTHAISIAEGNSAVVTFAATDVDTGTTLTWSISGTDANDFTINASTGVLEFLSAPDFEAPTDSGGNNGYLIIISISDGTLTDTQTLTISVTNVNEAGTISSPAINGTAYKGITITLTVTINTPGKVRFFVGGKRIANCLARPSSGNYPNVTATCAWKPANLGPQIVTASLAPSDPSFGPATSAKASIWVFRRTTSR